MKRSMLFIGLIVGLTVPAQLQSDAVDSLGAALRNVGGLSVESGQESLERGVEAGLLSPEQRRARIQELRKKVKDNLKMTPKEAQDALIEYALIRFADIFQELANSLGSAVAKVSGDVSAGEAVKRLPGAFADGLLLTFYMLKVVATQEYVNAIKAVQKAVKCLFDKTARGSADCVEYNTVNDALAGVFSHMKKFFLPIAQATVLGVDIGSRHVDGWLPLGLEVIAPASQVRDDVQITAELVNAILNFSDQFKDIIATEA